MRREVTQEEEDAAVRAVALALLPFWVLFVLYLLAFFIHLATPWW